MLSTLTNPNFLSEMHKNDVKICTKFLKMLRFGGGNGTILVPYSCKYGTLPNNH